VATAALQPVRQNPWEIEQEKTEPKHVPQEEYKHFKEIAILPSPMKILTLEEDKLTV
jgi:hypothetical protein